MKVIVKLGGSVLQNKAGDINTTLIHQYSNLIKKYSKEGHTFHIVTGGGQTARKFIKASAEWNVSQFFSDLIGIYATRLNALLIISSLESYAYPRVPDSWDAVLEALTTGKILVLGGMQPGQSTNAVAALLAELTHADLLINLTNVDGVYDRPPTEEGAKLLTRLTHDELEQIIITNEQKAGKYSLFDVTALSITKRSGIPIAFINGLNPDNFTKLLHGKHCGTFVTSS